MVEKKVDSMGHIPEATEQCKNPAINKCFLCKRDYCREHASPSYHQISLELTGFKEDFIKVLPRCKLCGAGLYGHLPYNPEDYVLNRYERLWSAIKRTIRAEQKAQREKQRAKAAKAAEAKVAKAEVVKQ